MELIFLCSLSSPEDSSGDKKSTLSTQAQFSHLHNKLHLHLVIGSAKITFVKVPGT